MTTDPAKRDVQISKALSYLLRHGALKEKLDIDSQGYVKLEEILKHQRLRSHKTTIEDIERIVTLNDKQRFTIKEDKICANQGHSLKVVDDSNLTELTPLELPSIIYHGTYHKKLPEIMASGGLHRMNRNHIHFTSTELRNISGIRKTVNVLIYLDKNKCVDAGLRFYKSLNDVILTPGDKDGYVRKEVFEKVIDVKTGNEVHLGSL